MFPLQLFVVIFSPTLLLYCKCMHNTYIPTYYTMLYCILSNQKEKWTKGNIDIEFFIVTMRWFGLFINRKKKKKEWKPKQIFTTHTFSQYFYFTYYYALVYSKQFCSFEIGYCTRYSSREWRRVLCIFFCNNKNCSWRHFKKRIFLF